MVLITALYAALLALLIIALSMRVVRLRMRLRIGVGDGGDVQMQRAIRVHANAVEYVPLALLLMALLELNGAAALTLHVFGTLLVIARLLHAWGLSGSSGKSFGRFWGALTTFLIIVGLALALLASFVSGWLK